MPTTFADLEAEIVTIVIETRDEVRWLKWAVQALLDQHGIAVAPAEELDE